MNNFLEIKDLKVNFKTYQGIKNILNIDYLALPRAKTLGVVGESESGKSVLALTILSILQMPPGIIESGQILLDGEDLLAKSEKEMQKVRGKEISMIFQDPMSTLNPVFTVGSQMTNVLCHNRGLNKKEAKKQALELIETVKLPDADSIINKYPHELSGGQRQRIIIALALGCGARLLIADEPTRNLDVTIQSGILKLIADLKEEFQVTVLFLTNNMSLVPVMCDRIAIIRKGRIMETGTVNDVINNSAHPYTVNLLKAMPGNHSHLSEIIKDKMEIDIDNSGCSYFAYCTKSLDICLDKKPVLHEVKENHYSTCLNIDKE